MPEENPETLRTTRTLSITRMEIQDGKDVFFSIEGESVPPKRQHYKELHHHTHYELVFVEEGELLQHFENGSFLYLKGDACLLNRNTRHMEGFESNCRLIFLNLPPDFLRILLDPAILELIPGQYVPGALSRFIQESQFGQKSEYLDLAANTASREEVHKLILSVLRSLESMLHRKVPGYGYRIMGLLIELFSLLEDPSMYHLTRIRVDASPKDFVYQRTLSIIREYHGRISRDELGRMVHYNPDYLNRLIKRQCGLSITQLGRQFTLEKAKDLLADKSLSISEIIQKLGFTNRSHFYRMFEASEGVSPGVWREQKVFHTKRS